MSEEKISLLKKLALMVKAIDNVEKSGENTFQHYKYVKATDVAWMVRKALSQHNVYLVSDVVEVRNYEIPAREGVMQAVEVKMEFSFFDGDDPATLPIVMHSYGTGTDKGDKAIYKAMTGALKYGLRNAFLIPDDSDPEGDSSVDKATANAQAIGQQKVAQLQSKKVNGNGHTEQDLVPALQASIDQQKAKKLNLPPVPEPTVYPRVDARGADVDHIAGEIKSIKDLRTKDKRDYKSVTVMDLFGQIIELSAFDNFKLSDGTLFQYLVTGAVGQQATFTYVSKPGKTGGKVYHNIINVSRIGSHRWDDGVGVLETAER